MFKKMLMSTIFFSFLLSFTDLTAATPQSELDEDQNLTFEFATPHTKWAKPYALGKIRVLFFVDASPSSLKPRECVELMQRFDIEGEAVFYGRIIDTTASGLHGGAQGEKRLLKLLEKDWDAFVFFEVAPTVLSDEFQYRIFKKVTEGAGLVLSGVNDRRVFKEKNLMELPGFLRADNIEAAFTVGKGLGVLISQQPFFSYYEGWQTDYDHWQEIFGRAILWSAKKAPDAELSLKVAEKNGKRELLVSLSDPRKRKNLRLNLSVKDAVEEKASFDERDIVPGREYRFSLPQLPEGEYYADGIISGTDGVVTWKSDVFFVDSYRFVRKVNLSRAWGEPGEKVSGEASLVGARMPQEKIRVSLLDRYRRELVHKELDVTGSSVPFSFDTYAWMPMLLTVEAKLYSSGSEISGAYAYYRVTKRNRGQFNFMMWGSPGGTLAPYAEEQLARSGVTVNLSGGNPPLTAAAYNISWTPYTMRITPFIDSIPGESQDRYCGFPFCWNDKNALSEHSSKLAKQYQRSREHGVFVYSLGDETTTQGMCLSSYCLEAYRAYLKEVYGTIENLNASWSTNYKRWEDVNISEVDSVTQEEYSEYLKGASSERKVGYLWFYSTAKGGNVFPNFKPDINFYRNEEGPAWKVKNYPRWYDRQAFKSYNFASLCENYGKKFSSIDPQALTGFEGAGHFEWGDDIDLIVRKTGWWLPYPNTADEVIRSIAPGDYPRGNWMGYSKDADSLLSVYWRMVTRGMNTIAWWTWSVTGQYRGWIAPDLRLFPAVAEIVKDTQVMRDGLGTLLMRSAMQDDGIAMLFSHPSYYARLLENGPAWGDYHSVHLATHALIRELGMQFSYVTDRMLRLGEFDKSKYRVLFLPATEAIGEKEAAVIEDFVRSGGTVIADVRPGIYDGHCKPMDTGILDRLFGIKRKSAGEPKVTGVTLPGGVTFDSGRVDTGIELAGGTALGSAGDVPVMITNRVGKGQAILLNFSLNSLPSFKSDRTPESLADYFLKVMEGAGVSPAMKVHDSQGNRIRNLETVRWKDGQVEIVALFRQGGVDQQAGVTLQGNRHVYDLRNRRFIGSVKTFPVTVLKNRASFYVLYPKEVPEAELKIPSTVRRGDVVKASVSVPGGEGLHAFRIKVENEGKHLEWYDGVFLAGKSPADVELPVAYNDPPGKYDVTVTDLFTDKGVTRTFTAR